MIRELKLATKEIFQTGSKKYESIFGQIFKKNALDLASFLRVVPFDERNYR